MGLFDQFPYTNFHELNLMWILEALKEIQTTTEQFVAINALKYADPIQWNITSQYEKNTIVIDPQTGTAYISVQPVPIGVALTNPDYWTVVFDLGSFVTRAAQNFTQRWEEDTTLTATFNTAAGQWLVWGDTLYRANVNITAGDSYVVDSNITRITVEEVKNEIVATIGDLTDLDTTDKSNLVAAINEVLTTLDDTTGNLADLDTTDKSNLVAAVNEVKQNITDKPFINVKNYGATGDGVTDDYQAFVNAIAAARDTGYTLIVPSGSYYISAEPAVTDLNSGDNLNLLLDYNVEFTGAGAGNPNNPVFNGKLLSPVCNKGNRLRGWSFKSYDQSPSPAGNGSTLHSIEWLADTTDDYIDITGSIANGSYTMTVSSTDGISLGAGVVPVGTITDFPDGSTKQNTARVVAIDYANNTIDIGFPSANPSAWAGIATASPWTGASISNQAFRIRKRAWNVTQFIGALAGSGNVDRIAYGQNIVTSSNGNMTYGIELDMDFGSTQAANADIIHKGLYILGFGTAAPLTRAISIEHSASNWTSAINVQNAYHGMDLDNVAGGISIHKEFYNRSTNATVPLEFGIRSDDFGDAELVVKLPFVAASQIVNGASAIYLKRADDTTPLGYYLECVDTTGAKLFGIDAGGNIEANAATINSGATTDTSYHMIIKATDGHTYAVPLQLLT